MGARVERLALGEQRRGHALGVRLAVQQRAPRAGAGPADHLGRRRRQRDHPPGRQHRCQVGLAAGRAAAGCDHRSAHRRHRAHRRLLARAKAGFALAREDLRHGLAGLTRDDVVEIDKCEAELARQQAADRRLACAHESDEKDRRSVGKRAARGLLFGHAWHYGAKAVGRFTELEMRGVMKMRSSRAIVVLAAVLEQPADDRDVAEATAPWRRYRPVLRV